MCGVDPLDGPFAFGCAIVAEGVDEAVGHVVASVGEVERGIGWGDVCAVGCVEVVELLFGGGILAESGGGFESGDGDCLRGV